MNLYSMLITAGGLATRLYPKTKKIPKSLVSINGKPFIDYQLRLLKKKGFEHVVLCVGFLGDMIRDYVGSGNKYGLNIEYSFDGNGIQLGQAGSIKKALPYVDDSFFVTNGDSYLPVAYRPIQKKFERSKKDGLMTIYKNEDTARHANNVAFYKNQIFYYGMMSGARYMDYGISIFNKEALDKIEELCYHKLLGVYENLIDNDNLANYRVFQRYYEVGSFVGIEEFEKYCQKKGL